MDRWGGRGERMVDHPDVAIVGAGPYGLSIAAYLRASDVTLRAFGRPMDTWTEHMPTGMMLKSDGFASNLADPGSTFTLKHFCELKGIPYDDVRIPVSLETMRAYGLAFQQRLVPTLENVQVTTIHREGGGFRLELDDRRKVMARSVVLAVGIRHFDFVPPKLARLPRELVTHSSVHGDVTRFRGCEVTVVGAGASAIDLAVLLKEAGADVVLVARRPALRFNDPPAAHRSLWARMRSPRTTIGPGWRSRLYAEAPGFFYRLPEAVRWRLAEGFLSPAAGWPMKDRFVGRVPTMLGVDIETAEVAGGRVRLVLAGESGRKEHVTDHVIAATGYRVDLRRLSVLGEEILSGMRLVRGTPVLSSSFETSIRGLYAVGMASKYCFGPVTQFACGADWTARRIARRLVRADRRRQTVGSRVPTGRVGESSGSTG